MTRFMMMHQIRFMVVATVSEGSVQHLGRRADLPCTDIIDQYFGDSRLVTMLAHGLEGRLMPRMVRQGEVLCVISKPAPDVLVGMFVVTDEPPVAQWRLSEKLDQELKRSWRGEIAD